MIQLPTSVSRLCRTLTDVMRMAVSLKQYSIYLSGHQIAMLSYQIYCAVIAFVSSRAVCNVEAAV